MELMENMLRKSLSGFSKSRSTDYTGQEQEQHAGALPREQQSTATAPPFLLLPAAPALCNLWTCLSPRVGPARLHHRQLWNIQIRQLLNDLLAISGLEMHREDVHSIVT